MTDSKSSDRILLEAIQARLHGDATPEALCKALKKHLKKYLGPFVPVPVVVYCKVCNKPIPQKPMGGRKQLCNKRCRRKRARMRLDSPEYKEWRKEYDAQPERREKRKKHLQEVYLPQQERVNQ